MADLSKIDQITNLHMNNEMQLFCFRTHEDGNIFGINVFKIKEIINYTGKITQISSSDSALVEGLITLRGVTIPYVDLNKWFHYDPAMPDIDLTPYATKNDTGLKIVICEFNKVIIGILIQKLERIISKSWNDIEDVADESPTDKMVSRTRYFNGDILQVVDIEKMLVDAFPQFDNAKLVELETISEKPDVRRMILYADDSYSVRQLLKKVFEKMGVQFKGFVNGKALLDYIDEHIDYIKDEVGLIITDLEMPLVSGFEVIKVLKSQPETKDIHIVVNSSMSGESNESMAKSLNADGFITKSNPKELEVAVDKFLT